MEILSDESINFPALYDAERDLPAFPLQDEYPTNGLSRRAGS